jgi:hypothetical protein
MARAFSGKVFNRPPGSSATELGAVADLRHWASASAGLRCLGVNIEHDWRVRPDRALEFLGHALPSGYDLKARLRSYFKEKIRTNDPDFTKPHNQNNYRAELSSRVKLVSVFQVNMTELLVKAFDAVGRGGGLSAAQPPATAVQDLHTELKTLFPEASQSIALSEAAHRYLDEVFRLCAGGPTGTPTYHPVWAALDSEFHPFLQRSPDVWLSILGIPVPADPVLCLCLRYSAGSVNQVFLPSVLESDGWPEHFPSPAPECDWKGAPTTRPSGGHTMSLHPIERPLLQEFIHCDFRRRATMVVGWGWTAGASSQCGLESARESHHSTLQSRYNNVNKWMIAPV